MISAFYTASTGAIELQKSFDTIANNMANVTTTGFKSSSSSFQDLLYSNIHAMNSERLIYGNGVKLNKNDVIFKQGNLLPSNRQLDYALAEDGFFAVQKGDEVLYTRNGNFNLTHVNGQFYLTSANGGYVLDKNMQPIVVENEGDNHNIGVFTFQNNDGLMQQGGLFFRATENSKGPTLKENAVIKRGYLEGSSVDTADQMAKIIESQRAFQFNSRLVQVADEIMQTVNTLR